MPTCIAGSKIKREALSAEPSAAGRPRSSPQTSRFGARYGAPVWEPLLVLVSVALLLAAPAALVWPALGLALAAWLLCGRAWLASRTPLDAAWLLLLLGSLIGLVVSADYAAAQGRFAAIAAAATLFAFLAARARSERMRVLAAWTLVALLAIGALAILALIRGSLPDSLLTRRLGPFLGLFAVFPGVSGDVLEVNSRFPVHQYGLAYLLLLIVPFLAAEAAFGARSPERRVADIVGAALLAALLAATEARGAMLALAVAVALVAGLRSRWFWAILPVGALGLYLLLAGGIISRSIEADWLAARLSIWGRSINLLAAFPLTGSGLGMQTFAEVFAWNFNLPNAYLVVHSHNVFIQAYAEQGLFGLVGMLMLLVGGLWPAWRGAVEARGSRRVVPAALLGALVATTLYGLTDQVPTTNFGLAIVAALCALAVAARRATALPASERGPERPTSAARRLSRLGLAFAALMLSLGLLPRWSSALALNAGEVLLVKAVLGETSSERRAPLVDGASRALEQAVVWNPQSVSAWRELARARIWSNDVPGAREALQRALGAPRPNDYERVQIGRLYYSMGSWPEAFDLWRETGQDTLLRAAAAEQASRGQPRAAAAAHAALIALFPDDAEHYANLAKTLLAGPLPSTDEALRWFGLAAELKPEARRALARQLVLQGEDYRLNERRCEGQPERALFWFSLAGQIDPTFDKPAVEAGAVQFYWAQCLQQAGKAGQAESMLGQSVASFQRATQLDPRNASSFKQLGEALEAAGRLPEAVAAVQQSVGLAPRDARGPLTLARLYAGLGRCDEARQALAEAQRLDPAGSAAQADATRLGACR
jgi:tetratricopeptide (TPR) repeat protein/O-antigen ligase